MCRASLAEVWVLRSLYGLGSRRPLRSSRRPVSGKMVSFLTTHPGFPLPSRVIPSRSRPATAVRGPCRTVSHAVFFPSSVFPEPGSHICPGGSTPRVTVPPQRFSRSRGLDPPVSCRPCLVPVPLLGFSALRGRSPRAELYVLSNAGTLLLLPLEHGTFMEPASGSCSLYGSLSRPGSTGADSGLLGLSASLRVSPASPGAKSTRLSWTSMVTHECVSPAVLQSVLEEAVGLTLSSLPPSSRFCHLVVSSGSVNSSSCPFR